MTESASAADIAGATFGGIAASAALVKAAHWTYTQWRTRPTHVVRLLNRIATQSASKEEENEAKLELVRLESEIRHQMLDGVMTKYMEAGDVEAVLALNRFRMVMDGWVEGASRVGEKEGVDITALQMGNTDIELANNIWSRNSRRNDLWIMREKLGDAIAKIDELQLRKRG